MTDPSRTEEFVRLLTLHQRRVYVFILAQLPNRADADDVLQETNVVLWNKFDQYQPGSDFRSWAARVAHFEVLKFCGRRRKGVLYFSDPLVEDLLTMALARADELDARQEALAHCLTKLRPRDRDLIRRRYSPGASTKSVAHGVGRSVDAIYKALQRIHDTLFQCIGRTLAKEGAE